jgi:hypothetical protein
MHVLVSLRAKTEWVLERDEKTGKTAPRKVGLAPVMRDGIEYEFDVCGEMDQENTLIITKSRCPKLTGAVFTKPGQEVADILKEWLDGPPPPVLLIFRTFSSREDFHAATGVSCRMVERSAVKTAVAALRPEAVS